MIEKKLNDNQLVWRIKARRCEKCLFTLVDRHSRLFYKISQKYFPSHFFYQGGQGVEDLIGSKESNIYECAVGFRSNRKVKFSTWLGNFIRYKCLNYLNKNSRYVSMEDESFDYILNAESMENHQKNTRDENYDYVLNLLKKIKDGRILKVFELRYLSGEKRMTWGKIGKKLDISSQTAINLHNKGKEVLLKKMKSKRYADKII